ncbi:hypothetical protein OEG84_25060 [Hoeflea sp. G2-23]|uniref:Uncharacterized protein n=1 Tax=Hoeflea algicola TaxID=2983763 RepID=A0ABT3ZGQ2_9HYPH|nr:hypothetical protein [Hoeflea algicola]MCY0150878.1 hypothetical protein [Hoeflea algicola]
MEHKTPEQPEVPDECQFLLDAFWSLNGTRIHNGMTLQPVQWAEFEAWQRGTGNILTHDERKIVMDLFPVLDEAIDAERPKPESETT